MTYRVVKCPKCKNDKKVYSKWFFRCCGRTFSIKECIVDYSNKLHRFKSKDDEQIEIVE